MPLTPEQMRQAVAAARLREDPGLQSALDRIVAANAEQAIWLTEAADREDARQTVLAVARLRIALQADAEAPEVDRQREEMARSFE